MDLFKKEEKGKEILNGGKTVKLRLKSNGKYTVEVDDIAVKVTQRGFMNAVNRGFSGTKNFSFQQHYRNPIQRARIYNRIFAIYIIWKFRD